MINLYKVVSNCLSKNFCKVKPISNGKCSSVDIKQIHECRRAKTEHCLLCNEDCRWVGVRFSWIKPIKQVGDKIYDPRINSVGKGNG